MRRLTILLAACLAAVAQDAQKPAVAQDAQKPAVAQDAQKPAVAQDAQKAAESPVPAAETTLTGWIDFGYRWRPDPGGSLNTYRSIVNLGAGPKLLGAEFTLTDPKRRLFDDIHVRASDWGDDPYSTLHVDARKSKLYDFTADYRNIAYFNVLPSYADPLLGRGLALDEQSFDLRRRFTNFELTLLPGNWISPYFAYNRDSGSGTGVSAFVANDDEFPVAATQRDFTTNYRGGLRFELRRFHATLEQGGTRFEEDQTLYQALSQPGGANYGNSLSPVFGQTLDLTDMLGAYGARGSSIYTKGLFTGAPASWLDLYGQFLYSQPDTRVNYQQYDGGNLYLASQILFYTSQQYLVSSAAQMPHTTGTAGGEIRPWRRMRITENWLTDRLHNAASSAQNQTLTGTQSQQMSELLASLLVTNYNQAEVTMFFDATSRLTLRGGYRYVWGDANDAVLPAEGLASADRVKLRRNAGIGGFTYRPLKKISFSAEGESASSGGAYFRTSLYDYQKVRAQARYQAGAFSISADFNLLNNSNPQAGAAYDYLSHQESLSLMWAPAGGKTFDFQGSYSRADLRSDIAYLDPGTLQPLLSRYRDNSHSATALFHLKRPRLTLGGSMVLSSGSRPTTYYQPQVRFWQPVNKHVALFADWRYYGYAEAFYLYEGFRAHTATAGVRYTR